MAWLVDWKVLAGFVVLSLRRDLSDIPDDPLQKDVDVPGAGLIPQVAK